MAFQKLFELIEDNRFENDTDKKIAEKIFEVERDWKMISQDLSMILWLTHTNRKIYLVTGDGLESAL